MSKAAVEWTDARLNALAAAVAPVPMQMATLAASVTQLENRAARMEPLPAQLAAVTVIVERLTEDNRALRAELASAQRQLLQMTWGLVAALIGAAAAVIGALI